MEGTVSALTVAEIGAAPPAERSEPTVFAGPTGPAVARGSAPSASAVPGLFVDSVPQLRELCEDARHALKPLASPTSAKLILSAEKSVQATLARVDELNAFLESLRSNSASASASLIPNLRGRSKQVERLFQRIDDFQGFVDVIEKSVEHMEKRLEHMETAYGHTDVKKFFSSILTSFSGEARPAKFVWTPIDFIEKTETHFS